MALCGFLVTQTDITKFILVSRGGGGLKFSRLGSGLATIFAALAA